MCHFAIGAEAKKVWMYIRHGTRSLKRNEIPVLSELQPVSGNIISYSNQWFWSNRISLLIRENAQFQFAQKLVKSFETEKKVPFTKKGWAKLKAWKLDLNVDRSKSHEKVGMITAGVSEITLFTVYLIEITKSKKIQKNFKNSSADLYFITLSIVCL